jgi:type I restriction enzyme, S subunit
VIEGLLAHRDYKPTPLRWLQMVPSHWRIERGKNIFGESTLPVRDGDGVVTCFRDGQVTLRTNRRTTGFTNAILEGGYQGVRKGQLVIHAMDAFAGAVGVSDSDGKCTPEYAVCDPVTDANPQYFAFLLREIARRNYILIECPAVRERAPRFRYVSFGNMAFPVPPPDEQAAIVKFLDHADRRIRRYIRAKQKLIKLLEEQKQAIIHQAVTRGLNPNVKLKPSGVLWLGDVPEHWEMMRAKQVCAAIIDCKNRTPSQVEGGEYWVVRTTCIKKSFFEREGGYPTDREQFEVWTQRGAPRQGDVFFTREAPAGEACMVPGSGDLCMGQRMMYFRPNPDLLDGEFLLLTIYGPVVRRYIEINCSGSTVGHLRLGQVYSLPLLWCSVDEQKQIVAHVKGQTQGIELAQARAASEVDLLREYRTRLISDVVTGKLDVRQAAASLPDEMSEEEPVEEAEEELDEDAEEAGEEGDE